MSNLKDYAALQPSANPPPPSPSAAVAVAAPFTTAGDWLISIGPAVERFKAEDAALTELHSAHVDAWLDCDVCGYCGAFSLKLRRGRCESCFSEWLEEPSEEIEGRRWR